MTNSIKLSTHIIGKKVGESIYDGETLLIKKGASITPRLFELLKKRGVSKIPIQDDLIEIQELPDTGLYLKDSDLLERIKLLKNDFFKGISKVASEKRYGKLLSNLQDYEYIEQLFIEIGLNNAVYSLLQTLKSWDHYSYYHSFDVFILGTMMYRKLKVPNIKVLATGLLLHDIGKIETPVDILNKPSKLTVREFELVSKHTTIGYEILKKYNFPEVICNLALSHHERINGTGYPNGLKEADIPTEIKISMIVDVYSALTLERAYRLPTTPTKAMQLILNESEKYDLSYLKNFLDVIKIYPTDSIVELSNNKIARIIDVQEFQPTIPIVKLIDSKEVLQLPNNYSLTVNTVLYWKNNDTVDNQTLIDFLIKGEKDEAISIIKRLCEGMEFEGYYLKIGEVMKIIGDSWEQGILSTADEHIATMTMEEIMNYFLNSYSEKPVKNKKRILLSTVGNDLHSMPNKIIANVLKISGWKVYNLGLSLPKEDLFEYIQRNSIRFVGFSVTLEENKKELFELVKWLKQKDPSIVIIAGGQALINYHQIEDIDFIGGNFTDLLDFINYQSKSSSVIA